MSVYASFQGGISYIVVSDDENSLLSKRTWDSYAAPLVGRLPRLYVYSMGMWAGCTYLVQDQSRKNNFSLISAKLCQVRQTSPTLPPPRFKEAA